MATARSANSNTLKPLTEKTYQQGGTPARRQAFYPLSDRLRVDILRWIAEQTTFRKLNDRQYRSLGMVQRCIKQAAVAHDFKGSTAQPSSSQSSLHN
ncbi:fee1ec0d-4fe4-4516-9d4f-16d0a0e71848-CDS [Sclerotinia trifoliorum]|uniref:Fee1ec0d-4fe4-4516-9d4f-16d0a0e71848-CDS n=1 Tax=Sclerotinia trifoliorum TaxID=28548 RepID=A0A8H2ZPH0_9HELO|nr:fee1ec0d-4fe4-4516-9d4f-16d0a0e71848-CDS [Sclerotinia trifoliorum]